MQLFAFGVNHHTAPLAVREQVTFHAANLEEALRDLVNHEPVREAAIISTCNRTEVYCSTPEPDRAIDWLARFHHLKSQSLEPFLYTLPRERAVAHAFRVASGLDSMVLGEPQILGQMKDAVKSAEHAGTLGTVLHKLFQSTFSVAKEVRTQTEIGTNSVSMAAAAVKVAERIYPEHCRAESAVHRRRRNDRAVCHTLRRQTAAPDDLCQSHDRARRGTGGPLPGAARSR